MGPEDDAKREVRALLHEKGAITKAEAAIALQLDEEKVGKILRELPEAECTHMVGFDERWRIRKDIPDYPGAGKVSIYSGL